MGSRRMYNSALFASRAGIRRARKGRADSSSMSDRDPRFTELDALIAEEKRRMARSPAPSVVPCPITSALK